MDRVLASVSLKIRSHVLATTRPTITLEQCCTPRTIFAHIRSCIPGDGVFTNKIIEALVVYLPNEREMAVREGNAQEFPALVRATIAENLKSAFLSVRRAE
ncbi:hypothetical protein Slin15195_G088210 [Septoria linicola]|uniref:Uncharacterized protein n=1 Tax=Septoria linicola TaxID=215465 RepID=A0A9Q9EMG4_9PEZI|nr:hypothetical protein Slin14017_G090820 [Septoria linicola]USW55502.1 hypothetical protein Slin15195_G088210 [Septoria linicola]